MIIGIGCDLCVVERIGKIMAKPSGGHFLRRVFAAEELALLGLSGTDIGIGSGTQTARLAAQFAAKEAFLKAVGTGLSGFALAEIAALRHPSGAPYYAFTGAAADYMAQHGYTAHLSLSHDGGMAMAYCVLERSDSAPAPI